MLLEGIVGLLAIIAVTVFVTKFVLEAMHLPVMSDQEWDIEMAKRPLLAVTMMWLSAAGSIASILGLLLAVIVLWVERKKLMACGRETADHGRGSERLRCGTPLYFTDGGPKVVRTEFVLL